MKRSASIFALSLATLLGIWGIRSLLTWSPQIVFEVEGSTCWGSLDEERRLLFCAQKAAKNALAQPIWLQIQEQVLELSPGEMGFELDELALKRRLNSEIASERQRARQFSTRVIGLLFGEVRERTLHVSASFDREKSKRTLAALAPGILREPKDAKLLIAKHKIEHAVPGRRLSVPATLARLESTGWKAQLVVEAAVDVTTPSVRDKDLTPVDITKVLSTYQTSFKGKAGPRGRNIRVAARYLNGAVILPGETLSFNQVVGRRVHGRGFVDAPVIVNDELEQDVGGGVCQVTTTLHGAAVFGHLDVTRRRSHSRPSGYAPIGLDATVIDGQVDFRIRNPYQVPLLVHAFFPERFIMRVELLGKEPIFKVHHSVSTEKSEGFARRIYFREEQAPGTFERKQKGRAGMDVTSILSITDEAGKRTQRRYSSRYYPVPEVFWVGKGVQPSQLPALPEGANSWLVEGQEVEMPEAEPPNAEEEQGNQENKEPALNTDPEHVQL